MDRIVAEINAGNFSDPVLEQMLLQLSKKLFQSKGRKQYGYLKPEIKKLVDEIVGHLSGEEHIRELYDHWYDLREDVLRTYTDTFPERVPLEQNKEFKSIRNAVVQYALQIQLSPEDTNRFDPPLSESASPLVDFPEDGSKVYTKAVKFLRDPTEPPTPQLERFFHESAIRGSVDAVYGMGKVYMKRDIQKAIGFFELAASQSNTYAEYQLGKIFCFGLGVPRDLDKGMEWLRASASHGNQHAASLLRHVQEHIHVATVRGVFGLLQSIAKMIQEHGEHLYQKRTGIDRKQRQKIIEKKMAQGKRHQAEYENYQGIDMQ